jgi:hypothetical protein
MPRTINRAKEIGMTTTEKLRKTHADFNRKLQENRGEGSEGAA